MRPAGRWDATTGNVVHVTPLRSQGQRVRPQDIRVSRDEKTRTKIDLEFVIEVVDVVRRKDEKRGMSRARQARAACDGAVPTPGMHPPAAYCGSCAGSGCAATTYRFLGP
jgi:hypothetical protein